MASVSHGFTLCPRVPQAGRGCPAGHRGRTAQGERLPTVARVRPIVPPEAVEGVAVGCAVARRWLLWMFGRWRGGPRWRCCSSLVSPCSVVCGGGAWCAVKNINILQKSYIKIWLYNVFVVHLHRVNKTNV
nr:MAG TPA: hypothetical protein [Caudoviricetes sp.]